jgi:hypothetical protein
VVRDAYQMAVEADRVLLEDGWHGAVEVAVPEARMPWCAGTSPWPGSVFA